MKKTILYIWDADYPWDVRVEKICRSLMKAGHEVHIASRNLKCNPTYEEAQGLHIHRIRTWKNDKLNYAFSFPAFFSPFWKKFLDSIITHHDVDLIIVRDLPMAIAGIWAGKRHGVPVIFDMAEDYVAMIWDIWRARKFHGLNLIVRNPYLAKLVEKYILRNADHILLVVEEAKDILVQEDVNINKTAIVGNTPSLENFKSNRVLSDANLQLIQKRYSAIYTGGVQMGRGIQTVIGAIPKIILQIPDFLFVIVGDGYAVDRLKSMAKEHGVEDYVLWVGWVDHCKIYEYIRLCDIGLIPHFVTRHVDTTIPNKIFDYMGLALPVIASDSVPMKRVIVEERCGVCFRSGDSDDLADKCVTMQKHNVKYGCNGREAVFSKYNWKNDEQRLLDVINSLI